VIKIILDWSDSCRTTCDPARLACHGWHVMAVEDESVCYQW
jgi:hypothetical protein